MKWRRTLIALHRDLGFFAVGLTLVYAVSGIAVNHREDWDYNYSRERATERIGSPAELLGVDRAADGLTEVGAAAAAPGALARTRQDALVERISVVLGRKDRPYKVMWRGRDRLSLLFGKADEDIVDYRPSRGEVEHEVKRDRFLIRQLNFLHLNEGRKAWTWIGDGYAGVLIFLALSGSLIVKGRKGLKGRGGVYLGLGVLVPVVLYLLLRG